MPEITLPESRARLGYLLSEMLSLPNLPADLNQVISDHLLKQISLVNILKPEYCVRLYPILAELADLSAKADEKSAPAEVAILAEIPAALAEAPAALDVALAAIAESVSDEMPPTPSWMEAQAMPAAIAESLSDEASPTPSWMEAQETPAAIAESVSDEMPAEIVNGAAYEQTEHFSLLPAELAPTDERSEDF